MVIEESKKDLKVKIEELVRMQFSEIENEKKHLENKFNIAFFIEKINELKQKMEASIALKNKLIGEYEEFKLHCEDKEHKLYREVFVILIQDLELKNTLISMKTRFRSDDTNENSYLPQKNNMNNEEYRKVMDHDNSNTLLSNDNVNKVYVEEIQFNELMDSNAKYNNSEQSSNILNY